MTPIEYLKLQAKNLHKDFKTQTSTFDPKLGRKVYDYEERFFKIYDLIADFNIDEEGFKLMNAQHVIAKLSGFNKWIELLKASPSRIELAVLLYANMDRVEVRDWEEYVTELENENNVKLDDDFRLQIFREVFLEREQEVYYDDYRLFPEDDPDIDDVEFAKPDKKEEDTKPKISVLPLEGEDRIEFIKTANEVFEYVIDRIEPQRPDLVRKLWNPEKYIDEELLKPNMLPIDRDYALSLIDAFLVHHVIALAVETDGSD